MEQGLMQPAPIEINPKERNKSRSWVAVAELQSSQEGLSTGTMAVNHKIVTPCGIQEISASQ